MDGEHPKDDLGIRKGKEKRRKKRSEERGMNFRRRRRVRTID